MKLSKVKYVGDGTRGHVYINGEEIDYVLGIEIKHNCGEVPVVRIERAAPETEVSIEAVVEWVNRANEVKKKMCAGYCKYADKGGALCYECPLTKL